MIAGNLAYDYIENIPWKSTPTNAFAGDMNDYLQAFESIIGEITHGKSKISFENDFWDFRPYNKYSKVILILFYLLVYPKLKPNT